MKNIDDDDYDAAATTATSTNQLVFTENLT